MIFRKLIGPYLNDELDDEALGGFLSHLRGCRECRDEFEINYIVNRGVEILDDDKADYNISKACRTSIEARIKYMSGRKSLRRLSFVSDTLVFWALLFSVFIFFRIQFH